MHLYELSHFFHAAINLSHRHSLIFLHVTNGMYLWSRPLHSFSFPQSSLSCAGLCSLISISSLPYSGYAIAFLSPYAYIPEAVCLTSLISVYDSPLLLWVQGIDLYDMYW